MDGLLTEMAKQVPAMGVLAFITVQFLGALKGRDAVIESLMKTAVDSQRETNTLLGKLHEGLRAYEEESRKTRELMRKTQEILLNRTA